MVLLSLSNIIGMLVTSQAKLSEAGLVEEVTSLDQHVSALLDADLDNPTFVSDPTEADDGIASVYSRDLLSSVAARTASSDGRRMSPAEWREIRRRIRRHPPRRKRWICCEKPERRRTRKGKTTWGSVCRCKVMSGPSRGELMSTWVTLSRSDKRPSVVKVDGKRARRCTPQLINRYKNAPAGK